MFLLVFHIYLAQLQLFAKSSGGLSLSSVLKRFQYILLLCTLILLLTSILKFSMMNTLIETYSSQVEDIYYAGRLQFLAVRIVYSLYSCIWGPHASYSGFYSADQATSYLSQISLDSSEMLGVNKLLYLEKSKDLSVAHLAMYTTAIVPYYNFINNNNLQSYTMTMTRFGDSINNFAQGANALSKLNPSSLLDTDAATNQVLRNGVSDFLKYLNVSSNFYVAEMTTVIGLMRSWTLALTILSIIIISLMLVVIAKPTVWLIEGLHIFYLSF